MKNITLSVDESILATVRRHAAERNSTVKLWSVNTWPVSPRTRIGQSAPGRDCGN